MLLLVTVTETYSQLSASFHSLTANIDIRVGPWLGDVQSLEHVLEVYYQMDLDSD